MKKATLPQAAKVLTLMEDVPCEQLQELLGSGLKPLVSESVVRAWREQDGVIYFTVTSDGTTGSQWIERRFILSKWAKDVLNSSYFIPTNGVTMEIAVLKGMLWKDNQRITKNIRSEADKRKLTKPNAEVACLIREMFSDKEIEAMGLVGIVAMHEPINDSDGYPDLLRADRHDGGPWLNAACGGWTGFGWYSGCGFAFVASQVVSTQD